MKSGSRGGTHLYSYEGRHLYRRQCHVFKSAVFASCEEFAKKVIQFRKQPLKTGRMLGIKFLAGLMLGMLTIPEVEKRVCQLLDIQASAIIVPYPEICNDVDKPSDLEIVKRYFGIQSA